MATPSALLMDETLSQLLESIDEGSLITPSLETPIQNMGLAETCQMVQNLELALRSFQDHVHLRLSQYRSHQNAIFPPISRLPVEIFSRILFQSVAVHDWTTIPDWSITRLQELAQVAKAWRDVILGTPEMWAVIKIHRRPGINPRWREDVDLVLERSRSAPLTVVYGVGKERYDSEIRDWRTIFNCGHCTRTPYPIAKTLSYQLLELLRSMGSKSIDAAVASVVRAKAVTRRSTEYAAYLERFQGPNLVTSGESRGGKRQ
ncbi:hypothetical protein FRB95_006064 [Tulasnella sp. JGI-2019a]|nr:hypothetical protein FRB95_006064 [Tulasnella sp. JGI-2019a]